MNNLLIVGYKPIFMSSNAYLSSLKRKYGIKSGGYLGTLDPFAKGVMLLGFGQYTRLFPHIKKHKKTYRATLWLGARSASLDIENLLGIGSVGELEAAQIEEMGAGLVGRLSYTPPKYSAKHVGGKRAYELARGGQEFELPACEMEIFDFKILGYRHPFLSFEVCVSAGGYVRSLAEILAQRLGVCGALSMLERIEDGGFTLEGREERIINPIDALDYPILHGIEGLREAAYQGKKLCLKTTQKGIYVADFGDFFSIIEVKNEGQVEYLLNRIAKC